MIMFLAGVAGAQDGQLHVDVQADPADPSVSSSGKVDITGFSGQEGVLEIGKHLSYPGVDQYNFCWRAGQLMSQRGRNPDGSYYSGNCEVIIDVSDVRMYSTVLSQRVVHSASTPTTWAGASLTCDNSEGTDPLTCSQTLSRQVTSTVTRSSHIDFDAGFSQSVNYRVGSSSSPVGAGGETKLSFNASWGTSEGSSSSETIGSTVAASTTVGPGQTQRLTLRANQDVVTVEIVYGISIEGPIRIWNDLQTKVIQTTVAALYDGTIPRTPGGRNAISYGAMPTHQRTYTETLTVSQWTDARVTQE